MSIAKFGAELEFLKSDSAVDLATKLKAAKNAGLELAGALDAGEVSLQEYAQKARELASVAGVLEKANKVLSQSQREAAAASQHAAQETYDLADAYEVLGHESTSVFTTAQQIAPAMRANAAAMNQVETATGRIRVGTERMTSGISDGTRTARQGFLDIARASQDFAQGGFPAIVNNLEGVGRGLGAMLSNPLAMLGSLPALLTFAGVAVLTFGGKVAQVARGILDVLNPGQIREFKGELDGLKDQIKSLEEKSVKLAIDVSEIDEAKRKLKELEADKASFDASQKHQSAYEAESGKQSKEALDQRGLPQVAAELKKQFLNELLAQSEVLKEVETEIASARQGYARDALTGVRLFVGKGSLGATAYEEKMRDRGLLERKRLSGTAETMAGGVIRDATEGRGVEQATAQRVLHRRVGISPESPEDLRKYDEEADAFNRAMDRAKVAGELRRAVAAKAKKAETAVSTEFKESLVDELNILKGTGEIDAMADKALAEAKAKGLEGQAAFAHVKSEVEKGVRSALAARNFVVPAGREADTQQPIGDLATQESKGARLRAETAAAKAKRTEATADNKEAKGEAKADRDAFEAEANRTIATFNAEAKRIESRFGREGAGQIQQALNRNPFADPEKIAAQVAADMAAFFRSRGYSEGGANVAAQQIASRAGFAVGIGQLSALAPDRAAARPRVARNRPRPGKTAAPKANPTPAKRDPRQARTQAEIEAERRRKAAAKPAEKAGVAPAVAGNEAALDANEATLTAMNEALGAVQAVQNRAARQGAAAGQLANAFSQVVTNQREPGSGTALPMNA